MTSKTGKLTQTPPAGEATPESVVGKLRDEIVESQRARTEFTKWKVFLIAGIGGAALGIGGTPAPGVPSGIPLLFGLLPPACLYVDIVCIHNDIRMMVIGRFLGKTAFPLGDVSEYEAFCDRFRPIFRLETLALTGTTALISIVVALLGVALPMTQSPFGLAPDQAKDLLVMSSSAVLAASGLLFLWKTIRLKDLVNDALRPHWAVSQWIGTALSALGIAATIVAGRVVPVASAHRAAQVTAIVAAVLVLLASLIGIWKERATGVVGQSQTRGRRS